ncbi:MAG TPA: PAS domain S-box protein [Proteobacteria bacterium]|nr:phytochrome-like protein cph1 [bacterium BMS3Abin14]HDL53479.1 PAS domain S-box protein [Pseudomonadota bacterium]
MMFSMGSKASADDQGGKAPLLDGDSFRAFMENSPLPVFIIGVEDPDHRRHRFLAANAAARKMYGYSEEEFRSLTAVDLHPAEEKERVVKAVKKVDRVMSGQIQDPFPFRHILKDGTTVYVQVNAHPIRYLNRRARLVIVHDVTKRHEAERIVSEREAQYRLMFEAQADAVMIFNRDGRLVDANPAARRMYGYRKDEMLSLCMKDLVQPDYHHMFEKIRSTLQGGKTFRGQSLDYRKDGTSMDVEIRVSPITYYGEPHALVVARDITSTKATERQVRESRDHLRALYRASPDMIFLHGEDGRVIDVNKNVLKEYGAKSVKEFKQLDPGGLMGEGCPPEMAFGRLTKAFQGEPQRFSWNARRLDGSEFPVEVRLRRVKLPAKGGGASPCVIAVVRNISDLQEAERSLNEAYEKLEMKNVDMESFLYSAGHDLRTPLVSIKGYLELLVRSAGVKLSDDEKQMCARINGNIDRLDELLKDLLQLSHIGVLDGKPQRLRISSIVERVLESEKKSAWLLPAKVDIQKDIPDIFLHEIRAYQLFRNLISNSLKFQKEKRPLRISIGCSPETDSMIPKGHSVFYFQDNGIGIAQEYHEMIFDLFTRPKESPVKGTGVGLAIVKRVVEAEGGNLRIESKPGKGTVFYFSLPVVTD